jgi:hypothetical protein
MKMRFAVEFLLALAIAGPCAAEIFPVDVPPPAVVPSLETGARPAPVSFSRMAANLAGVRFSRSSGTPCSAGLAASRCGGGPA